MMSPRQFLRLGVRSLLLHKLRSTLSILGVVFGVAAVVAMSSVGEGARHEALEQVGALGIDTVTVRSRPAPGGRGSEGLRLRDAEAVRAVVPGLLGVAPVREATLSATSGGRATDVTVLGTTPGYQVAARLPVAAGRFLADLDVKERKRVAVLGATVARALFPLGEALGGAVDLGGDWYQVIGVLEGRASPRGKPGAIRTRDVNRAVFVPLPALDRGDSRVDGIDEVVLRVDGAERVTASAELVKALVRRTSGTGGFEVVVPREILRQKERTQRIFNVVTGAVAAISLLVGGIGIMNIMLASVAERRHEVGIRRALGATREDIAAQFLVEASLLTSSGGALGAGLGVLGSHLIQYLAGWPTALSPWMLVLALLTALAVGIGFGSYPAWHAAQVDPMQALREE